MKLEKLIPKSNKGQVVTNVILGVGALIVGVIVTLVIIQTLNDASLLGTAPTSTVTTSNETQGWINQSGYTLANVNGSNSNYVITEVWNATNSSGDGFYDLVIIFAPNYTVSAGGILSNITTTTFDNVSVSYTLTHTGAESVEQQSTDRLVSNFTTGIDNVGDKIPVILLIVAVVFLFGALVLLVQQSKRMGLGSGSTL